MREKLHTGIRPSRTTWAFIITAVLLVVLVVVSLMLGRYVLPVDHVLQILWARVTGQESPFGPASENVVWTIRLPRTLAAMLIGAALACSGAAYQALFRNPMVSPDILGVSSGAGVGAALAILLSFSALATQGLAFVFGIGAVLLVMTIGHRISRGNTDVLLLVLIGLVVSSLFSALSSLIKYVADPDEKLPEITYWLMGSLARAGTYSNVLLLGTILFVAGGALLAVRWRINLLAFGDEEARSLGVNTRALTIVIVFCATLLTASSVASAGLINWIGLIIPHIARLVVGPDYKRLLPFSMLCGAGFLLAMDDIARSAMAAELPIGMLSSIIGAPVFIWLLYQNRRRNRG